MKPLAVYLLLKYLQQTVKFFFEKCPHLCFFNIGAYDQIWQFFKNLRKKFAIFFAKMHEKKVFYIGVSYSNFN